MMLPPTLPEGLRRKRLKNDLKRIIGYAVWILLWYLAAYSYNDNHKTYPDYRRIIGWKLALWMVGSVIIGFFLFRIYRFLTMRMLTGTVKHYRIAHSYTASGLGGEDSSEDSEFRTDTKLILLTDGGKKRRLRFEQKPGFYLYYAEGTRILRFRGFPYPLALDKSETVCLLCGTLAKKGQTVCERCDSELVVNQKD